MNATDTITRARAILASSAGARAEIKEELRVAVSLARAEVIRIAHDPEGTKEEYIAAAAEARRLESAHRMFCKVIDAASDFGAMAR